MFHPDLSTCVHLKSPLESRYSAPVIPVISSSGPGSLWDAILNFFLGPASAWPIRNLAKFEVKISKHVSEVQLWIHSFLKLSFSLLGLIGGRSLAFSSCKIGPSHLFYTLMQLWLLNTKTWGLFNWKKIIDQQSASWKINYQETPSWSV